MRRLLSTMAFLALALVLFTAHAQQPAGKDKGPMAPAINPAAARLDVTIPDLDGPGFDIAAGKDTIAASCENGTIQVFKKETIEAFKAGKGKPEPMVLKGHTGPVRALAWHGGPTLVSVGADKKINFWKMPEGKVASSATADHRIRAAAMSKDGKTLATAGESETIQLWDVAAGKPTVKLTDKMDWSLCVAFSADGKQLLSGDWVGVVRLWDASGKKLANLPAPPMPAPKTPPDPVSVTCVAFAPDGKTAVLGNADGLVQLFNLGDGKIVRTFTGHTGPITGIVFHPSGTVMATCSKDRTVKLWNPAGPQPAMQATKSLDGHGAWIEGIVFIEEGTKLATVSADQTVRIWDLTDAPKKK